MPNANPTHTPPRSVRVSDELWKAGKRAALVQGTTISEVLNAALAEFVLDALTTENNGLRDVDRRALRRLVPEDELRRIITHIETSRPRVGV